MCGSCVWAALVVKGKPTSDFQGHLTHWAGLSWDILCFPSRACSLLFILCYFCPGEVRCHCVRPLWADHWTRVSVCLPGQSMLLRWSILTTPVRVHQQSFRGRGSVSREVPEWTLLNLAVLFSLSLVNLRQCVTLKQPIWTGRRTSKYVR